MAINLQDSAVSYGFQKQQQQAVHIRITREVKEALERAKTTGEATSLQLPGAGAGLVIKVGDQKFETHPPSSQQKLHVFTQAQEGCTEVAEIQQRAVVKRSSVANGHKQPAVSQGLPAMQPPHRVAQRLPSGPAPSARKKPSLQEAEPVRKPHLQNGTMQPVPVQAAQQKFRAPLPQPGNAQPAAAPAGTLGNRHPMNSKPAQVRPHPASGSHPSVAPPMPSPSQPQPTHQQALPAAQQPSHNASAGGSSQSAQTAAPKDLKGKSGHARASAAAGTLVSSEVLQKVCAIAEREEKPNQPVMLAALMLCKPPTSKHIEALMLEVEKRVRSFQRMQGNTLKGIYQRLSNFKPGNVRQLKAEFHEEAERVLSSSGEAEANAGRRALDAQPSSSPAAVQQAQPDSHTHGKKKAAEHQAALERHMTPTPEPQSMGGNLAEPQQAAQGAEKSKKKRKRLTKAADIAEVAEGGHGDGSAAGLQKKLQVAGLTDSEPNEDATAGQRGNKSQKTSSGYRPSSHPQAAAEQQQPPQQQPAALNGYHHRADSLGPDLQMADAAKAESAAAAPAVPKIKLKIKRRWSAGCEDYDDSWFAQHVDRQPQLKGPVSGLQEFEEMVREYDSKHAIYFKLHQEIQDTRVKVEGLQQAIHKASSEAEKVKYQEQFKLMWNRRLPHTKRWDKALAVLHAELETMHQHLQAFYDQHQRNQQEL